MRNTLHEGSLVATTDGSGNVTGTNVLSPYGEVLSSNTSDSFSYAGLTQDTEYGGDAATFRNYTTEQLRWTRPDPDNSSYDWHNPQTMNRYVYAMDDPLGNIDPSGMDPITWENENGFSTGLPADATWGTSYSVDGFQVSNSLANALLSSGAAYVGNYYDSLGLIQSNACEQTNLNATNEVFGTNFTTGDVIGDPYYYSMAGPSDTQTMNLNISAGSEISSVAPGRYPLHSWTYVFGIGPTLHVPGGPGGLDSGQTIPFGQNNDFTEHLDNAYAGWNPLGDLFHVVIDIFGIGRSPCP